MDETGRPAAPPTTRVVHRSEQGMRLDRFLRIHFQALGYDRISNALRRGRITVDGARAKPTDRLAAGQTVSVGIGIAQAGAGQTPVPAVVAPPDPAARAFLESILVFADDDLLVFDKPSGLAVHAGTRTERHLDGLLDAFADPRHGRPMLVHRLDKDTSGLIVAARRREVAAVLGRAFATRAVEKEYRAVVAGVPAEEKGVIDVPLVKIQTPAGGRMVDATGRPDGLPARTRFAVLRRAPDGGRALLALFPETGRQHQLRIHMALSGHPIHGDRLYGAEAGPSAGRLLLHAAVLNFKHPRGQLLRIACDAPGSFDAAIGLP
jgi:23S rRNA pseudouridine955/2504/2580 synthase